MLRKEKGYKNVSKENRNNRHMDRKYSPNNKPSRRTSNKKLTHKHVFVPAMSFDWQDNDLLYGICACGEKDI